MPNILFSCFCCVCKLLVVGSVLWELMWCIYSCSSGLLWASYQIRKIAGCACAGNAGNVFPRRRIQRKPRVSNPGMHHGTCVTHVPWCMSGLLNRGGGENVPGIPGACAPAIRRIWQEAHSLNGRRFYRKISWRFEAAIFGFRRFQSPRSLTMTSAAALPRSLSNFRAIWSL